MKIACVSTSQVPSLTANSIQVMKVCQALSQLGHTVKLWVPGQGPSSQAVIGSQYGIQVDFGIAWLPSHPRFKRYDFAWQSIRAAERWPADLIYTWTPQAALLASIRGIDTILEMHDRATGTMGPWILRKFLTSKNHNLLVCITQALRQALENQLDVRIPEANVVIAPNGVDLERYDQLPSKHEARVRLGLPEMTTISYTGHFYTGRGTDILFHLAEKFPQVQFLWVGGRENELSGIRQTLVERDLRNVTLTGFVDNQDLPLYHAASDILLMPYERSIAGSSGGNSADICSPMKMFEYMAAGRVILTSDLPVIREVLDETCAYFCPPEDKNAWAAMLDKVLQDPDAENKAMNAKTRSLDYTIIQRERSILAGMI